MKLCNKVGCNKLLNFTESYCEEHKNKTKYDKQRYIRDNKVMSVYNNKMWKDSRQSALVRDDYMCLYCLAKGYVKRAEVVDHYVPIRDDYDKRYDLDNLVSSCYRCNNLKAKHEEALRQGEMSTKEFSERWKYSE